MKNQSIIEADRLADWPHPRDCQVLFGHHASEQIILSAYRSFRMPHAWLIQGQEGIGKSTFAYRIARFVLANPDPGVERVEKATDLSVNGSIEIGIARQISAQSHPNLRVLRRKYDAARKKLMNVITIDSVQDSLHFLSMTSSNGGWRVLIVDVVDDMNDSAINALLKTVEEPTERALLLLVTHVPGKLPATLRSRCCKLPLNSLNECDLIKAIGAAGAGEDFAKLSADDQNILINLSRGSVRRALIFLGGYELEILHKIEGLLTQLPHFDTVCLHNLVKQLGRVGGQDDFTLAMEFICNWMYQRLHIQAKELKQNGGQGGDPMIARIPDVWEQVNRLTKEIAIFNFDRKRAVLDVFNSLAIAFG